MGRDTVNPVARAARVGGFPTSVDWLIDVQFTGLKTGRLLSRRIAVTPNRHEQGAILSALNSLKIHDRNRIVALGIRKRYQSSETHAQWRERLNKLSGVKPIAFRNSPLQSSST